MQRTRSTTSSCHRVQHPLLPGCLFFLLLLLSLPVSDAQSCEPLTQDLGCEQFGFTTGSIVFTADLDIPTLEQTVLERVGGVNFLTITEPCRSLLIRMSCVTFLRHCVTDSTGALVPLPVQNCLDQCDQFVAECTATYEFYQQPVGSGVYFPPNETFPLVCATQKDFYAQDQPFYPVSSTTYTLTSTNETLVVPCNNLTDVPTLVPRTCATGLSYDPDRGGCSFTCVLPSLTDDEYYNAKVMQGVIGWFSWVGTVILIWCYSVDPVLRNFPRNLILMSAIAANIAAGAIILPSMVGYFNIWCGGDTTYIQPSYSFPEAPGNDTSQSQGYVIEFNEDDLVIWSSACTFQGAILQFGYLAATFWWGLIALNIFLEVYFGKFMEQTWPKWIRIVCYHIIGWGVPFLFMVIPAAAERIKFSPGGTYCFITTEDNGAWLLTFWIVPVAITLFFATIFFILALIRITIVIISLRKFKELLRYGRLLVFIFLYLFLFSAIFAYHIQVESNSDDITDGYSKYYECASNQGTDQCEGILDDSVTNYDFIMLKGWAISTLGFLLFLIFMSWEVLRFWYLVGKAMVLLAMKRNRAQAQVLLNLFLTTRGRSTTTLTATDTDLTVDSTVEGDGDQDRAWPRKSKTTSEDHDSSSSVSDEDGTEMN